MCLCLAGCCVVHVIKCEHFLLWNFRDKNLFLPSHFESEGPPYLVLGRKCRRWAGGGERQMIGTVGVVSPPRVFPAGSPSPDGLVFPPPASVPVPRPPGGGVPAAGGGDPRGRRVRRGAPGPCRLVSLPPTLLHPQTSEELCLLALSWVPRGCATSDMGATLPLVDSLGQGTSVCSEVGGGGPR